MKRRWIVIHQILLQVSKVKGSWKLAYISDVVNITQLMEINYFEWLIQGSPPPPQPWLKPFSGKYLRKTSGSATDKKCSGQYDLEISIYSSLQSSKLI